MRKYYIDYESCSIFCYLACWFGIMKDKEAITKEIRKNEIAQQI